MLVLREKTERPEGVESGRLRVVGVQRQEIVAKVSEMWEQSSLASYDSTVRAPNPYGDGRASERIAAVIKSTLGLSSVD